MFSVIQTSNALKSLVDGDGTQGVSSNAVDNTKSSQSIPSDAHNLSSSHQNRPPIPSPPPVHFPSHPTASSSVDAAFNPPKQSNSANHNANSSYLHGGLPAPPGVKMRPPSVVMSQSDGGPRTESLPTNLSDPTSANHFMSSPVKDIPTHPVSLTAPSADHPLAQIEQLPNATKDFDSSSMTNQSKMVKTETPAKAKEKASSEVGQDQSKGIMGHVKKGLLKWLYPDAHDATENLGDENKAYFDKNLNRWVFPGQVSAQSF